MALAGQSRRRGRFRLTEEAIVGVALQVVRTEGLSALTMRRIAQELQTSPMSLYRHIPDRQGLVLKMLDEVALRIVLPPVAADPREELTAIARAMRDCFVEDPWVVLTLATDGLASPHILPLIDRAFSALYAAGLTDRDPIRAWSLLFQYLYGEALSAQLDSRGTAAGEIIRAADRESFPGLSRMLADNAETAPQPREDFAVNLDRLLDVIVGDHTGVQRR